MKQIKSCFWFIFLISQSPTIFSQEVSTINFEEGKKCTVVIFSEEFKFDSLGPANSDRFTPSISSIHFAEKIVRDSVARLKIKDEFANEPNYNAIKHYLSHSKRRQYFGLLQDKKKVLYINSLFDKKLFGKCFKNWTNEYELVFCEDNCKCFNYQITVDLTNGKIIRW